MRKITKVLSIIIATFALVGCHSKEEAKPPSAAEIVMQLRDSDKLYVTEYQVHKVVTANDVKRLNGKFLNNKFSIKLPVGDRKIAIPMDAVLKGYIDFSDFQPQDVIINADGSLAITLPEPKVELTSTKIDHAGVREYTDLLRSSFTDAEMSDFEQQARAVILASVPQMGIVETAKRNAYDLLVPIFMQAGFDADKITITFIDHER